MEKRGKFLEMCFWEQQGEQVATVGESQRMCCLNRLPHSMESHAGSPRRLGYTLQQRAEVLWVLQQCIIKLVNKPR